MFVNKNEILELKKNEFYFVIDITLKRKNKKLKIISKFQIKINVSLDKFNANSFNTKSLFSKNKFT